MLRPAEQVRRDLLDALDVFAKHDQEFTLRMLREVARIKSHGSENTVLWNVWRALRDSDAIAELPSTRRRNRVYKVVNPERLRTFRQYASLDDAVEALASTPGPHDRRNALEQLVRDLTFQVSLLQQKVNLLMQERGTEG